MKRKDIETIGVRTVYIDGDKRGESEIVTVDTEGNPVAVGTIEATSTGKTEMFDISGRRVSGAAANGVIIKRTTLGDGTVRVEKIMRH